MTNELVLNKIQHIGIPVTDIAVSEAFYIRLGFTNVMESGFLYENKTGTCIMMQRGQMIIELYQMPDPKLGEIRNRKDGHIDHIAFDVPDVDKTFSILKNAGFAVIEEEPVFLAFWEKGCKFFNR
jgi:catechol 2,3-dioxygenase-like lactoylglutathione lyase family enzyme